MLEDKNFEKKEPEIRYVPVQFIDGYAPQSISDKVEIDLIDGLKKIWDGKSTIIKTTIVFLILGVLYAYSIPNKYSTTIKLLPEAQQNNTLSRLGGLAAQFGLGAATTGVSNDVLPPQIYPEILTSSDFLYEIIKEKVYFDEIQDSITIQEFYFEHQKSNLFIGYTLGLPFKVLALFHSVPDSSKISSTHSADSYKRLSPIEMGAIWGLRGAIEFYRDPLTGVLTLNVNTQSPEITVQLANHLNESLSNYLITYRTEKSRRNLAFLAERHAEARESFTREQDNLATFRDQNQGNLSAVARTIEQNIQSEYTIKLNVYNSLTEQLEQARIKLQEDTPVVSILNDSLYPNSKSGPNRKLLLILSMFVGILTGTMVVLYKPVYQSFRNKFR